MLIALALLSGSLLAWPALTRKQSALNTTEAIQLINQRHALILDIRSTSEFAQGHIAQAKSIPLKELEAQINRVNYDKKKPVLITCATGGHSSRAMKILRTAGHNEIYYLEGGLVNWQKASLPLVK